MMRIIAILRRTFIISLFALGISLFTLSISLFVAAPLTSSDEPKTFILSAISRSAIFNAVHSAHAAPPSKPEQFAKYEIGSGGKYILSMGSDPSEVIIGFVQQTATKLVVEIKMKSLNDTSTLNIKMVQQFHLTLEGGKIKLSKGIMKIPMLDKPQILPANYLGGYTGVQLKSFLIQDTSDMKKVSEDNVIAGGQTYKAQHFRHNENNQKVDYWISDVAKPLGLVKLESQGGGSGMTYTLTYQGKVTGVKAEIDEAQAVPMSSEGAMFLPLLPTKMLGF